MKLPFEPVRVVLPLYSTSAETADKVNLGLILEICFILLGNCHGDVSTSSKARNQLSCVQRLLRKPAAMVLPSDVLYQLRARGLEQTCLLGHGTLENWWRREVDSVYLRAIRGTDDGRELPYPLLYHEDGVPTTKNETVVFWSWSSALTNQNSDISRFCSSFYT